MKVDVIERRTYRTAYDRRKFCTCGEHEFVVVEQLEPYTHFKWRIECPYCGRETNTHMYKHLAIREWMD